MILVKLRKNGATPGVLRKEFNAMIKAAFKSAGELWVEDYRPRHFQARAFTDYPSVYIRRKGQRLARGSRAYKSSYTGRKERTKGHTLPLVYSGDSEERTEQARVVASSKGVRVRMNSPALNFRHPKSRINPRAELIATNRTEDKEITAHVDDTLQQRIDALDKKQ